MTLILINNKIKFINTTKILIKLSNKFIQVDKSIKASVYSKILENTEKMTLPSNLGITSRRQNNEVNIK